MRVSVIIPVWNGAGVIADCLTALYGFSDGASCEVICVDNASTDGSAAVITQTAPQAQLLPQAVNLGFAGGVNAGMQAASGDIFVLLNQDCLLHEGWLPPLLETFAANPSAGIMGGTIYNADGSVNHAGAEITYPLGYGRHLTAVPSDGRAQSVDYVTGAIFAIKRSVWEKIGPLDEDFFPAYFEESDYCYRAKHHGFSITYLPDLAGTHLFSSTAWKKDPIRHNANQHRARYRFIAKHFGEAELSAFFPAEAEAISQEKYDDQANGRLLALRDTLTNLPLIATARERDLGEATALAHARQLQVGFTDLYRQNWYSRQQEDTVSPDLAAALAASQAALAQFKQQEYDLIARIYYRHPRQQDPETRWQRLWRLYVKRPLSFITLRDYYLLSQLNSLHVARIDQLSQSQHISQQILDNLEEKINHRLTLLETLTAYEFR